MEKLPYHLLFFGVLYIVVFFVNYLYNRHKIKKGKTKLIGEANYLIGKFKLDPNKINYLKIILPISLINALIISFVTTFITALPISMIWQLMIGFVLLFALIYALYEILGRHYIKKGYRK